MHMTNWRSIVAMAALMGCAGAGTSNLRREELSAGHYGGSVEREGWSRALFLDLERDGGAWHGKWRALIEGPSMSLDGVEVRGDQVRFDAGNLRFIGRVAGDTLT